MDFGIRSAVTSPRQVSILPGEVSLSRSSRSSRRCNNGRRCSPISRAELVRKQKSLSVEGTARQQGIVLHQIRMRVDFELSRTGVLPLAVTMVHDTAHHQMPWGGRVGGH